MISLDKMNGVSFDKGCYPGQEIVARTHYLGESSKELYSFRLKNNYVNEKKEIINISYLIGSDVPLGLNYTNSILTSKNKIKRFYNYKKI